jgi:hypothetical protein
MFRVDGVKDEQGMDQGRRPVEKRLRKKGILMGKDGDIADRKKRILRLIWDSFSCVGQDFLA